MDDTDVRGIALKAKNVGSIFVRVEIISVVSATVGVAFNPI